MFLVAKLIITLTDVLFALLCIRALCTWLFGFNWPWVYKVYDICVKLTEFIVAPCRKITDRFSGGMFDWSVLLAFLVLILIRDVLVRIVLMI